MYVGPITISLQKYDVKVGTHYPYVGSVRTLGVCTGVHGCAITATLTYVRPLLYTPCVPAFSMRHN